MKGPAEGVQIKGGRYYKVQAKGKKRIWHKLTKVSEGLPALFTALADWLGRQSRADDMPKVVAEWCADVMSKHSEKTQVDERRRANIIAESFSEARASEVEPPDCDDFLKPFSGMPRTYDLFRAQLRSIFRYCERRGYRKAGTNPVDVIPTMGYTPRSRYITDSELRRIKVGGMYGDDGKKTRSGLVFACFVEITYLTAADVSVVLAIREKRDPDNPDAPHVCDEGVFIRREKTERTSRPVIVVWTPRLRAVVNRLLMIKKERQLRQRAAQRVTTPYLLTQVDGTPLSYSAASNAWQDAMRRSKVAPAMIRDLRAKGATDKEEREGIQAASDLLDHSTQSQTAAYIRRKKARKTAAAA